MKFTSTGSSSVWKLLGLRANSQRWRVPSAKRAAFQQDCVNIEIGSPSLTANHTIGVSNCTVGLSAPRFPAIHVEMEGAACETSHGVGKLGVDKARAGVDASSSLIFQFPYEKELSI